MDTLMIFTAMLLVAMVVEPLARFTRLPFSVLLVLVGFVGSELIVMLGFDTGLRWDTFNHLILQVFVPILVFESAFNMNARALISHLPVVLFLAVPAMVLAAVMTGLLLYFGIGHATGFPLLTALLCGSIVSATDPVAVVALCKQLGAPERLGIVLEGESLFNDATAVVLFTVLIGLATMPGSGASVGLAFEQFLYDFLGGAGVGLLTGAAAWLLYQLFSRPLHHAIISLATAATAFYLGQTILHVSGIMTVLCAGLLLGECHRRMPRLEEQIAGDVWELAAYVCTALLFLLVGVTITGHLFSSHWLAMLIGVVGATLARATVIYVLLPLLMVLLRQGKPPASHRHVLMWGGVRGAVCIALALSLPTQIEGWYTAHSVTYGVVLFTLFVQAPLMAPLVRRAARP